MNVHPDYSPWMLSFNFNFNLVESWDSIIEKFGSKNIKVQKNLGPMKIGSKIFGSKTIQGFKKMGQNQFWVKKKLG